MVVGGYTLHLYCDHPGHAWSRVPGAPYTPDEFAGPTKQAAYREARAAGWSFSGAGGREQCFCPGCRRKK